VILTFFICNLGYTEPCYSQKNEVASHGYQKTF